MKTMILFPVAIAVGIFLFSCKKTNDMTADIPGKAGLSEMAQKRAKELNDCQVQQIISPGCCSSDDTLLFNYNSWGDPETVHRLPYAGTGRPNFVFKYDSKRRVSDIIGMYEGEGGAEFWHKYYYENPGNSNIVKDSTFLFVRVKDGKMLSYLHSSLTYYRYDNWDRIVQDSTIWSFGSAQVNKYAYDANGNLVGRTYDNKTNIHRTNRIWMFLDRDYSVNNPFPASEYNRSGLPTYFRFTYPGSYYMKFLAFFSEATITYDCGKKLSSF